jgi:RHS repeat-associated protein
MLTKDALGRLVNVVEDPNGAAYTTAYGYDALDNLTSVNQGGRMRTFVYDSLSRLMSATNPESASTWYAYDAAGNLYQKADSRGITTTYSYDVLNRLTGKSYTDGTLPVSYVYDASWVTNSIGRLTQASNNTSSTYFTAYDSMGRVQTSEQILDGSAYIFQYSYNLAGALVKETYPSGRQVSMGYDGANRVSSVGGVLNGQTKTYVGSAIYAPQGSPLSYSYGNTLGRSYTYNSRMQPSQIQDVVNGGTGLFSMSLDWGSGNNNGTLRGSTTYHGQPGAPNFAGFGETFSYDKLNRLTAVSDSGNFARTFGYDAYGNMWLSGNNGLPVNGLTPTGGTVFTSQNQISGVQYDAAGNQTSFGSRTISYDAENRQRIVTESQQYGGDYMGYLYDGLGQRVWKYNSQGPNTVYVYDALGQLAAEYSPQGVDTPACTTCFLSTDHLGSTRLVTDQNGKVVTRHDYVPFGEEVPGQWATRNSEWGKTPYPGQKFTGQERDAETDLDYFHARYYSASVGRFLSADPGNAGADLANPQTWNGYAYAGNNPLVMIDPSGMGFWSSLFKDILDVGIIAADVFTLGASAPETTPILVGNIAGAIGGAVKLGIDVAGQAGGGRGGSASPLNETLGMPAGTTLRSPLAIGMPDPLIWSACGQSGCVDPRFWNFYLTSGAASNWSGALNLLSDFLSGGGASRRTYGTNSPEAEDLEKSAGFVASVRKACASKRSTGSFSVETGQAARALPYDAAHSPTGVQVGGYVGRYTFQGSTMHISINNDAGAKSFFYHLVPNSPFASGPLRTISQQFDIDISRPCGSSW